MKVESESKSIRLDLAKKVFRSIWKVMPDKVSKGVRALSGEGRKVPGIDPEGVKAELARKREEQGDGDADNGAGV